MSTSNFTKLKSICTDACHERQACAEGYKQMRATKNVSQMMATWRANWDDVVNSKYADIICTKLPDFYPRIRKQMNESGVYHNECPQDAKSFVRILITKTEQPVHVYGDAKAYILDEAEVVAHDHAEIYNNNAKAKVTLLDRSFGSLLETDEVIKTRFAKHITHHSNEQ